MLSARASLSLLLLASSAAYAQTGNGVVKGTVQDPARAVVPGAKVVLTNQDTNVPREALSTSEGLYSFAEVPPGPYTLLVQAAGFKKWTTQLTLQAGQTADVDPSLEVGSTETTVEVSGATPVINTEGMQVSDVKDALRIHQLPLNGRAVSNLFDLTPGVEGGGAPRVNGMKVGSAEILQDGVSIVSRFGGDIDRVQPGLDTVQEFRIETNGSNARYSHPATISLVTKSGTNNLHGSAFDTFRNNAAGLRARQRQDGNSSAKYIRNEFGASAGGPVYLPKIYNGRNRTFWFFSYEGLRQREKVFQSDIVPTSALWSGDFSQIVNQSGVRTHIYDPTTTDARGVRQQFPNDVIPASRLSPFYKTVQGITHAPTNAANPFLDSNLQTFYPLTTDSNTYTVKLDQHFSEKDSLSGRFTRSNYGRIQTGGQYGSPIDNLANAFGTGALTTNVYSASVNYIHSFSPNFLSETLLTGHRYPTHQGTLADSTKWADQLGLPNPFGETGWPTFYAGNFGWDSDNRRDQNLTAFDGEENLTFVKGKHSMVFGFKMRHELNNVRELQQTREATRLPGIGQHFTILHPTRQSHLQALALRPWRSACRPPYPTSSTAGISISGNGKPRCISTIAGASAPN